MAEQGHITEAMAKAALANPAEVKHDKSAGSINYAADYVMDALNDTIGAIDEDIVVTTTIDLKMQAEAERALTDELNAKGAKFGVEQGALVALDPNGAIKAMVGGRNYADSQFNRAVAAKRQPGSSFKPFVYLAALEKGLTPDTVREDAPITVKGWSPENYSREYFGPVTLTKALALSLNTVAVRLGLEVGPKAVVAVAHRLGITSDLDPVPSIALGSSDVTPLEMVSAYAAFANGGIGVQPHVIARVRTAGGKQLYVRRNANFGRVIDPQYVAMMNQMMQETLLIGTARKAELPGLAGRRQDGHQPGLARRLVHRLHELSRRRRLARQRRQFADPESVGRQPAGRDLEPVHEGGARGRAGREPAARDLARRRGARARTLAFASAGPHRPATRERRTRRTPAAAGARAGGLHAASEGDQPPRRGRRRRRGGSAASARRDPERRPRPPARDKGLLDKLFGTL